MADAVRVALKALHEEHSGIVEDLKPLIESKSSVRSRTAKIQMIHHKSLIAKIERAMLDDVPSPVPRIFHVCFDELPKNEYQKSRMVGDESRLIFGDVWDGLAEDVIEASVFQGSSKRADGSRSLSSINIYLTYGLKDISLTQKWCDISFKMGSELLELGRIEAQRNGFLSVHYHERFG